MHLNVSHYVTVAKALKEKKSHRCPTHLSIDSDKVTKLCIKASILTQFKCLGEFKGREICFPCLEKSPVEKSVEARRWHQINASLLMQHNPYSPEASVLFPASVCYSEESILFSASVCSSVLGIMHMIGRRSRHCSLAVRSWQFVLGV
ncbi:uncharacterized protein LOC132266403 isoform X8 [Cornus florida]|uniref:uncharacterized protein LOC132266403 isoform X8 n=1 Tax=Cornus florida TaxID=4283 RepID=UPI0028A16492|nr:uncharacterized protein LOC132266403 isoform X8 [Cornus florida]